jgi:hypothetical protein
MVGDYLFNIVWHNLGKVRCMYRDVLDLNFPDDSSHVHSAVIVRHDIVHRSGKSKKGRIHYFRDGDIERLLVAIEAFVNEIETQLQKRAGNGSFAGITKA